MNYEIQRTCVTATRVISCLWNLWNVGGAKGMVSGWTTLKNLELFWIFTILMSKLFRNLSPYILFCVNLKIHLHVRQWFYFLWEMLHCNNLQTFKEAWKHGISHYDIPYAKYCEMAYSKHNCGHKRRKQKESPLQMSIEIKSYL